MNSPLKPLMVQIGTVLVFLIVWEIVGESKLLFAGIVPSVFEILRAAWSQVSTGSIFPHLLVTVYEASVGLANAGLGFIIIEAFNHFRVAEMYASILLTFFLAAMVNVVMTLILVRMRGFAH